MRISFPRDSSVDIKDDQVHSFVDALSSFLFYCSIPNLRKHPPIIVIDPFSLDNHNSYLLSDMLNCKCQDHWNPASLSCRFMSLFFVAPNETVLALIRKRQCILMIISFNKKCSTEKKTRKKFDELTMIKRISIPVFSQGKRRNLTHRYVSQRKASSSIVIRLTSMFAFQ